MANQILVDIYKHLRWQIEESSKAHEQAAADQDADGRSFYKGKLDELTHLRGYLSKHYNLHTQRYD